MNLSYNHELFGAYDWSYEYNDNSFCFGTSSNFKDFDKAEFRFSNDDALFKDQNDHANASFETKLMSKSTSLYTYSFPSAEMVSTKEQGDMKLNDFHDSVIAHDETGSKYSEVLSKRPKNDCSSVFSIVCEMEPKPINNQASPKQNVKLSEDIDALIGSLTSTPHFKDQRFSTRRDVVNKTIMRIMKRFYIQLFKDMFPKVKAKKTSAEQYLNSCSELISRLQGGISCNDHLKYFIVHMLNNKLLSNVPETISMSLDLFNTCLYSYSDKALRRIYEDSSSRLLFNYFYQYGQSFFLEQDNVQKNLSDYKDSLDVIYQSFNGSLMK